MAYTLAEVDSKLKVFCDKMGSDYFPMSVLLKHFVTASHKFIGEKLRHLEKTQEVVDDIRSLLFPGKLPVMVDPNDDERYIAAIPINYLRLASYDIIYDDGYRCRRADLVKQGSYNIQTNDPNKRPDKHYPAILQENNLFEIDCGPSAVPATLAIKYFRKPVFAKTNEKDKRIVNLPDEAIENIILSTVTSLFESTGDQRFQSAHFIEDAYRKYTR